MVSSPKSKFAPAKLPKVSIVIPTWNKKDECLLCLDCLQKLNYPREKIKIIVVDNASTDGTKEAIKANFPQITVLRLRRNKGFGAAVNKGIDYSRGKYVYILDNDVIVHPNALGELVSVLEEDQSIGFAAGKLYDYFEKDKFQTVYGMLDRQIFHVYKTGTGERDLGQYEEIRSVDFVSVGSGLARRTMLEKVGLLDERYFIYFDDTDLFFSCQKAGYKVLYVPTAKAWHKGSSSLGQDDPRLIYYLQRNNLLIRSKFNGFTWIDHLKNFRFFITLFISAVFARERRAHQWAALRGIIDFYRGRFGQAPEPC